jgi:putative holliday junction resolvase
MSGTRVGTRLGVDVGTVRVGLAACDRDGRLAFPVATVPRDPAGRADQRRIHQEAVQREVIEVLVGLPLSMSGREGPAAAAARGYAVELAGRLEVPVRLVDERLSTVAAHRSLRAAGVDGRRQRAVVDQVAAVVLLQAALDQERATGTPAGPVVQGLPSTGA